MRRWIDKWQAVLTVALIWSIAASYLTIVGFMLWCGIPL